MLKSSIFLAGACAVMLTAAVPSPADAEDSKKPDAETNKADAEAGDGIGHYCSNIAPTAVEARIAWQMKCLSELDAQIKQRIVELDAKETEAREWVNKREDMLKKAADDIVAIYSKMKPEAASAQLIAMDDASAAAILSKLNPRAASAILNEMEAARAAKLENLVSNLAKPASPAAAAPASAAAPAADGKKS